MRQTLDWNLGDATPVDTLRHQGFVRLSAASTRALIAPHPWSALARQVAQMLQAHPAVAQVVTFGMPHAKLGEDVAAAVVLREGQSLTERELREFAATRLADFKVPRKILFMAEIPKGATGKLQRIGLAEKLGLTG